MSVSCGAAGRWGVGWDQSGTESGRREADQPRPGGSEHHLQDRRGHGEEDRGGTKQHPGAPSEGGHQRGETHIHRGTE